MVLSDDALIAYALQDDYDPVYWYRQALPMSQWIQENFYLYDTGDLYVSYPIVDEALRMATQRHDDGSYVYPTVIWSWPKKSAKSTTIAARVDYIARHQPRSIISLIGNDLRQATSRVGFYLRENIKLQQKHKHKDTSCGMNPEHITVPVRDSGTIVYPNGSRVEMLPVDPSGEAGGNQDMIVCSELWGWKNTAHQAMWAETTISPTKYGRAQRWVDTYAGFTDKSPVLYPLWEAAVKNGERCHDDYEFYHDPVGGIFAVWVTMPQFPWQTDAYYAEQRATLTETQFNRMHRNAWETSDQAFLPTIEWWDACLDMEVGPHHPAQQLVIGIDAGTKSDCFAIVAVTKDRRPDRDHPATIVRYAHAWYPERMEQSVFTPAIEELTRLCSNYNVVQLCYDPWQMTFLAEHLEALGDFVEFKQSGSEIYEADALLYQMVRDRRIVHTGQSDLRTHMQNAQRKESKDERILIDKSDQASKVDLARALSMANKRAIEVIP